MSNRRTKSSIAEAVANLRTFVKPGDTVFTILRHTSSSGTSRVIDPIVIRQGANGKPDVRTLARMCVEADLGSDPGDRYEGVKLSGCGMDMGFALVYNIGRVCFPEGFGVPCARCGRRPSTPQEGADMRTELCGDALHRFNGRNGNASGWDNDGGYALEKVRL